jgi:hypothetical protein
MHRGYALALVEMVEELQRRIDKVTGECGVNWINEVLKGEEPPRTSIKPGKSGTSLSPTEWLDYK